MHFIHDESEPVMRELSAEKMECLSLETCFSGCSVVAAPAECSKLNKLQCQQLKQRAMRLAGVQRVNCRRQCRRQVSKCAALEQNAAPVAAPASTCAQKNLEGECMEKEVESLQDEILKEKELDDEQILIELFGEAEESELEGEFEVTEATKEEYEKALNARVRVCRKRIRDGKLIK